MKLSSNQFLFTMTKRFTTLLAFIVLLMGFGIAVAQPIGKVPAFLETPKKTNFFKMQKKAEKYFAKKKNNKKEEEQEQDTTETPFESEIAIGGRKEDNEYHRYQRWEWYWRERVNDDGTFPDAMKSYEVYNTLRKASKSARLGTVNPNWTSISRKTNTGGYWGLGRTESVAINPKNSLEFYVTSNGGGVWKTADGGKNYVPVGDQLPVLFCGKVLIDHQNTNTVYVSTGDDHVNNGGGLGVYKSTDGGGTWEPTGLAGTRVSTINVKFMAMSPGNSQIILAATNKGLYRTSDGGVTWLVVRSGNYSDVAFRPGDGNTVFAANYAEVFRSTDAGVNWQQVTTFGSTVRQIRLSTSAADPEYVAIALFKSGSVNEMYASTNRGSSFAYVARMGDGCEFYVSNTNKNNVYCGCVDNFQSKDGGKTWAQITHWSGSNGLKEVHADNHGINYDPGKPWDIYISNDGGVDKYNEQTNTWTYLSDGLEIAMYYQLAVSQTNPVVIAGGTQDNGGMMRKRDGTWRNTTGGDANMCLIDPSNENILYSAYINGGGISRTTNAWTNRTSLDPMISAAGIPEADGDWVTPFAIHDANPKILIAGYKDVIITFDRGDNWKKISTGLSTINLKEIAISPTNSSYIYTSEGSNLYRTFDQGLTWTKISHPGGRITKMAVHPTVPKTLYSTNNGGNGKRVYKSTDGGSTWANISAGIPNDITVSCIIYDKNTDEGLYIGTMAGIFYKDATMSSWIYYGMGMPNTDIIDIQISYPAEKVRVATFGRGIWENELYTNGLVTEVSEETSDKIQIYPNPFQDGFYVSESAFVSKMRILSLTGAVVEEPSISDSGLIRVSHIARGHYILEITGTDGTVIFKKIVKE